MKKNVSQQGFSLVELLVVAVVASIIAAISVIGYQAVVKGTRDKMQTARLMQYVDAQNKFKTVKGKRRFGTMQELREAGLLNASVADFDKDGNQSPQDGWTLIPGEESTQFLREHFWVKLEKPRDNNKKKDATPTFCIGDDGVLRRSLEESPTECDPTSPPYQP